MFVYLFIYVFEGVVVLCTPCWPSPKTSSQLRIAFDGPGRENHTEAILEHKVWTIEPKVALDTVVGNV